MYIKFIGQYKLVLLVAIIGGAMAGFILAKNMPRKYDVSMSLKISKIDRNNTSQYYAYDGYYTIQSTDLFGDTVAKWFANPDFVLGIVENTGQGSVDKLTIKDLRGIFVAEKVSADTVEVVWSVTKDDEQVSKTFDSIKTQVSKNLEKVENKDFEVVVNSPVVKQHIYSGLFFGVAGGFMGALLGIIFGIAKNLSKESK
jgi:hypothetical protein